MRRWLLVRRVAVNDRAEGVSVVAFDEADARRRAVALEDSELWGDDAESWCVPITPEGCDAIYVAEYDVPATQRLAGGSLIQAAMTTDRRNVATSMSDVASSEA